MIRAVTLADGWTAWSRFEVRSAGFSLDRLEALSAPDAWRLACERAACVERARAARAAATEALRSARAVSLTPSPYHRALRFLAKGRPLELPDEMPDGVGDDVRRSVGALEDERTALAAADQALASTWAEARRRVTHHLFEEAGREDLVRALLWQNPDAVRGALAAWRRHGPDAADPSSRKAARLVVSYLQRYAAKNDTVGFFGPVAFGDVEEPAGPSPRLTARHGPGLVRSHLVHLEPWAAGAVADALALEEELRPHLALRPSPRVRVADGALYTTRTRSLDFRRLLGQGEIEAYQAACAGHTLASVLEEDPALRPALDRLLLEGIVRLELPVELGASPERALLAVLERPGAPAAFGGAAARVRALLGARDRAGAATDPDELDAALVEVDRAFTEVVKARPRRRPGETYAARTPAYWNCHRDVEVALDERVLREAGPGLALLLRSARWFTAEVGAALESICAADLDALRRRTRAERVPLSLLYEKLIPIFAPPGAGFLRAKRAELQRRWREVLGPLNATADEVRFAPEELRPRVDAAFPAAAPGWPCARHHSPDLLFAKTESGLVPVLGEIHAGLNTLGVLQAVTQCPFAEELQRAFQGDVAGPLVSEIPWDGYGLALQDFLHTPRDLHLDTGARWTSPFGEARQLALRHLDAVLTEGPGPRWRVTPAKGAPPAAHEVDGASLTEVFERIIRLNATMEFHPFDGAGPAPRIRFGSLVVARRRWRLEGAELARFLEAKDHLRMATAAELARALEWPRHLFARVASEPKPVFVDLASPASLEVLAHVVRRAERVDLSEMLPAPDEAWLEDADGKRYVAELRVVVTDPTAFSRKTVSHETLS